MDEGMNKICTSIEQSEKLIKLGIDRKTSDMYYWCGEDLRIGGYRAQDEEYDIPAWSLSALMELFDGKAGLTRDYRLWFCYDNGKSHGTKHYENPIDAAFEMICWLNENNNI